MLNTFRNDYNHVRPHEALNGKLRTLTRRSYGFHSAGALIALLYLCCAGIHLHPVRTYPLS